MSTNTPPPTDCEHNANDDLNLALPCRSHLGKQPIVATANFQSAEGRNWNMLFHSIEMIYKPTSASCYFQDESDLIDRSNWPVVDYDFEVINSIFANELDADGGLLIKWANICGMHSEEDDAFNCLRADDSVADDDGKLVDNYWKVRILTRDDPEFWTYAVHDYSGSIGIDWQPDQEQFSKLVLDWARERPTAAQLWLDAKPDPMSFATGEDEAAQLAQFLKKVRHSIRQGLLASD